MPNKRTGPDYLNRKERKLASSDYINIDDLENPGSYDEGDLDVLDFPSGGRRRKGSDVLDRMIQLEKVKKPKKKKGKKTRTA